jgi:hypothetical protein
VSFLRYVAFGGSIDGEAPYESPADGTQCAGEDGYSDLVPGATVVVADGSGAVLATAPLGAGQSSNRIRNTQSERVDREGMIDAIYGLRVAKAHGDRVLVAQLNLDRANLRLHDLDFPGPEPQPFEGHPFIAVWCSLPFSFAGLPVQPGYTFTVTHRGATTYSAGDLAAKENRLELVIG